MSSGRTPPQDIEAERATLGAMLLNPDAIMRVLDIVGEHADMFYVQAHQQIYTAIIDLYRDRDPVDMVTLTKQLADKKQLKKSGGPNYIAELTDAVPTSANAEYYAKIVLETWKLRTLIVACTRVAGEAYGGEVDASELAKSLLSETSEAMEAGRGSNVKHISDIIPGVLDEIQRLRKATKEITGASTGIPKLDELLLGLRPDTLNIIGARPSVGKSAIAVNIANGAAQNGHPVLMFSLEMRRHALARRFMTINTLTPYKVLCGTSFPELQNRRIHDAVGKMNGAQIFVDDSSRLNIYNFTARCRRFAALHEGIMPVIILDYLTLCEFNESRTKKRYELIGEFTREAKLLAGELGCPIIILAQLGRDADPPMDDPFRCMKTLRESGNIEADADTVCIALQEKPKWLVDAGNACAITDLGSLINFAVIKNRDGPVGACPLVFDKTCQHVMSLADYQKQWDEDNQVPQQAEIGEEDPLG